MLTGPRRSILARSAAMASSALTARAAPPPPRRRRDRSGPRAPVSPKPSSGEGGSRTSSSSGSSTASMRASGIAWPSRSSCSTSTTTSSSVALTASSQVCRQMREIGFRGRAGDVELRHDGAHAVEHAAGVPDGGFVRVAPGAQRGDLLVEPHHRLAQRVELADVDIELRVAGGDRRPQLVGAAARFGELDAERGGALFELGGRLLEALDLERRARPRARRARRARRRLPPRDGSSLRPLRAPRTGGAAPQSDARRRAAGRCRVW